MESTSPLPSMEGNDHQVDDMSARESAALTPLSASDISWGSGTCLHSGSSERTGTGTSTDRTNTSNGFECQCNMEVSSALSFSSRGRAARRCHCRSRNRSRGALPIHPSIAPMSGPQSFLWFFLLSFLFLASIDQQQQHGERPSGLSRWVSSPGLVACAANNDDDGNNGGDDDVNAVSAGKDDDFVDLSNVDFDAISVMPVSCLRYNNGHMIKFELFENASNYQCHFRNQGTFVVSIAHFMRAYFNHQALIKGPNFILPNDAGYLNCIQLEDTGGDNLYAKIGCMERETFTSTKLALHVYTDAQCSNPYDDGFSSRQHVKSGYNIDGYYFNTKVSFRPPFYTCQTCAISSLSSSFTKSNTYWYDDDYIATNGQRRNYGDDDGNDDDGDDDQYFQQGDDGNGAYQYKGDDDSYNNGDDDANNGDDAYGDDDDGTFWSNWFYRGESKGYKNSGDDDFYNRRILAENEDVETGQGTIRGDALTLDTLQVGAVAGQLEAYNRGFWGEVADQHRRLDDQGDDAGNDAGYDGSWNMCERIHKYGMWCDEACRDLDTFRVDEWSAADIFLVVIMCLFMASMMLLIFAKRVKAYEKASIYGNDNDQYYPGLPPMAMVLVFILVMTVILVLADLKFVNETLVFAVVMCILLFIYMLKLTLFERKSPPLLPPSRKHYFS